MNELAQWLHCLYVPERQEHFNQVVANVYARQLDQNIRWHSDRNPLLAEDTDICYITLGPAKLLCFAPHDDCPFRQAGRLLEDRKEAARRAGLQGFVPLMPGDMFLVTGSFPTSLRAQDVEVLGCL